VSLSINGPIPPLNTVMRKKKLFPGLVTWRWAAAADVTEIGQAAPVRMLLEAAAANIFDSDTVIQMWGVTAQKRDSDRSEV
jgi:hypothetical protein